METNTDTDRRPSVLRMNGRLPATVDHDADDTPAGLGRARCVPITPMLDRRSGTSPVAAPPPDERVHGSRVVALRPRGGEPSPMGLPVDDGGAAADFEELIGVSAAFKRAMRQVAQVGPTDASVLITGETGTGKELIARRLHACSARRQRPLGVVNCAALPTTLVESELFGHERGAFTGAVQRKPGRFELADGGTIFLDEIGELPLESQAKLLRVLEEREFERVGGTGPVRVDVRMIAATNQPLETRVAEGAFRADLFYRLDVYRLALPPLRDRAEDIWLLADHFVRRCRARFNKPIRSIDPESMERLLNYRWPGNIRELRHTIERAVLLSEAEMLTVELPSAAPSPGEETRGPVQPPGHGRESLMSLQEMERQHIQEVLRYTGGLIAGKAGAAEVLGLPPSTLRSRMKKLGLR
jgi:formate hydrogenlyase transcriptional activator